MIRMRVLRLIDKVIGVLAGEEVAVQQALMEAGGKLMARRREVEIGLEGAGVAKRETLAAAAHEFAFLEK